MHMIDSGSDPAEKFDVLVADDHGIVREGLQALLLRSTHCNVVGTAASGTQAVAMALRLRPHVVVMDLVMPKLNGLDATERIRQALPATKVVIVSMCQTSEHIVRALRAGANAYVLKQSAAEEIVHAVHAVLTGKRYLSAQIEASLGGLQLDLGLRSPLERLSAREREVLNLTVAGVRSNDIARQLSLSPKTVETYRSRIMAKLGVNDRTALIHFAIEHALTPL